MIQDATLAHLVHTVFEAAGIAAGSRYYVRQRRQAGNERLLTGTNYAVLVGCLLGAAIGNKLAFWIEVPNLWFNDQTLLSALFSGQSMVGGLLGGLVGVEAAKFFSGTRISTGDAFVYPILLGLMIGRIGCFLAGLNDGTFGVQTDMPWGIDFGDGVERHPTQLYEIAFSGMLWAVLLKLEPRVRNVPGLSFKIMLSAYLLWRLIVDSIKPHEFAYPLHLSGIQWLCVIALLIYLPFVAKDISRASRVSNGEFI